MLRRQKKTLNGLVFICEDLNTAVELLNSVSDSNVNLIAPGCRVVLKVVKRNFETIGLDALQGSAKAIYFLQRFLRKSRGISGNCFGIEKLRLVESVFGGEGRRHTAGFLLNFSLESPRDILLGRDEPPLTSKVAIASR
jgi:hypothetical protein